MKKSNPFSRAKLFFLSAIVLGCSMLSLAQTVAVSDIYTHGVDMAPDIAAKMTRIELIKLDKYVVLDVFDMNSALGGDTTFEDCYGKTCLIGFGKKLDVAKVLSGSYEALGKKIIITLKLVDVKTESLELTKSVEFGYYPNELSRMVEITLREMHGLEVNQETKRRLGFEEEVITSTQVGRINNSGPRFGIAAAAIGDLNKFFQRKTYYGGLDIFPIVSNLGYQFEIQYVGTENFSALFEIIPNIGGMEQGHFIPSLSLLNGFRFGQAGWEFAFGPALGVRKVKTGYLDGTKFYSEQEWFNEDYRIWASNPVNVNQTTGEWLPGQNYEAPADDVYSTYLHKDGYSDFNASWVMAIGRTFRKGGLNVPVNMYYSGNKFGGMIGMSVGFNVVKSKKAINQ